MTKEEMLAQIDAEVLLMVQASSALRHAADKLKDASRADASFASLEIVENLLNSDCCDISVRSSAKKVKSLLLARTESRLGMFKSPNAKGSGRKVDPNSARQRVWAAVKEVLGRIPKGAETEKFLMVEDVRTMLPDLTVQQIETNAMDCPGVMRAHGFWSLE